MACSAYEDRRSIICSPPDEGTIEQFSTVAMTFKRLVRFEEGDEAKFADLLSGTENGFVIKPLKGSLEHGLEESDAEFFELPRQVFIKRV